MKSKPMLLFLVAATVATATSTQAAQPNILWISCEDISAHIGCYGDPHATTPNIDRLASQGVRYDNAFVAAGVCAPCRSSIITGMYQTTIGTHHMRCKAELPENIKPFPIYLREAGYYCSNNSKKDYQFKEPKETWDQSNGKAHWRNREDKSQPFFAVFNFTECHESGIASDSKYKKVTEGIKKHDPAKLTTFPPYYPDTPVARADWGRYYDVVTAMDRRVGKVLAELEEDGLADNTIVIYWSDHGVGLPRGKRWLYDSGMKVPMVVRIPEKLRVGKQGAPGTATDELVSLMDLGPTALNIAGLKVPGHVQGRAFLGDRLSEPRTYVYGARDRMDERYDIIRAVRDKRFKYIRNYEPFKTYYQYMNTPEKGRLMKEIRRVQAEGKLPPPAALFLRPTKPIEELYDLEKDPHEINNIADLPLYRPILERMRQAHLNWVTETRDLGLMPEPEIIAREKALGSRYAILRQRGSANLVQRIRNASSAALKGEKGLDESRTAMKDGDATVRYWGAIGIGNSGKRAMSSKGLVSAGLKDKSASVRIASARALCRMGDYAAAIPTLTEELASKQEWVRLNAAIVLDEIDDNAKPAIAGLKEAVKDKQNKYVARVANRALNEMLETNNTVK
ncbi:MAG: sulfatase-like hydrolase/transferase [Verrucomicrobiia bacterium]|jgi:uncharacterized sulfatase